MKAIILERRGQWAAALREDGIVVRTHQAGEVGDTVELEAEILPMPVSRGRWLRTAAAAVLALAILGGTYTYTTVSADAYVSLDVGQTSVELSVNRLGRIISVTPLREDDRGLASDLTGLVKGKRVEEALTLTVERLEESGYLRQADATVIAGVTASSESRSEALTGAVESAVTQSGVSDLPLYTVDVSPEERREARNQSVSGGRYVFAQRGGGPQEAPETEPASGPAGTPAMEPTAEPVPANPPEPDEGPQPAGTPEPSPANMPAFGPSPAPDMNEFRQPGQSPVPDTNEPRQPDQSPVPDTNEPRQPNQSPVPDMDGLRQPNQSPAPDMDGLRQPDQSPTPDMDGLRQPDQSPVPDANEPRQPDQSPVPDANEPRQPDQSPVPDMDGLRQPDQSPAPNLDEPRQPDQSPAPNLDEPQQPEQSPAPNLDEPRQAEQSSAPNMDGLRQPDQFPAERSALEPETAAPSLGREGGGGESGLAARFAQPGPEQGAPAFENGPRH